jgi:F-type H+-transporting ATPase subunit gamma
MATIRQLKRRIGSIKNTAKISATQSRPYADKLSVVLAGLATGSVGDDPDTQHPLLAHRPVQNVGVVHITPDRGLCGALNSNMNRSAGTFVAAQEQPVSIIAVGKKGRDFFNRARINVVAELTDLGDYPTQADTATVSKLIIDDYVSGRVDRVYVSYPLLVSTAVQRPVVKQVLPLEAPQMESAERAEAFRADYIFEPNPSVVLERLLPRYVEVIIYDAILQMAASFQSAQMVAMKNATDNAHEIERELTLTYNKTRQEQITKELLDIVGGAAALED